MLRKLTKKLKGKEKDEPGEEGSAVPYREPELTSHASSSTLDGSSPTSGTSDHNADSEFRGLPLGDAAAKGDIVTVRRLLSENVDVNGRDKNGNTALHRAVMWGHSKTVRYLLLHAADIEAKNLQSKNVLRVAVESGYAGTVGVLLDYMHSVDNRPREPFVLLRAKRGREFLVEEVRLCSELRAFRKRGADIVQLLIAHAQQSEALAVFLYSVLDVPVGHAFFTCSSGDVNLRNLQRFENKSISRSLTVLNTPLRVFDTSGYSGLRSLILVSCGLVRVTLDGLVQLQLLDLRYNRLESLPQTLRACTRLATLRCSHNRMRRLPSEIGNLSSLLALDVSYNQLKRLPSSIVRCVSLASIESDHNSLLELPADIGLLTELQELTVENNKLSQLPLSLAALEKLERIRFSANPLQNIPTDFSEQAADVRGYLASLQDDPVPNKTVKLVIVGQEGVGKTTLLRALKRTFWALPHAPNTAKTDGVDIKDIQLDDVTLRCFDCGGDVDFNETHNFFITHGALYLTCFNLSEYCLSTLERGSFLLGRLQLWLQYIFSRVPTAQVLIIGTHADHDMLNRTVFEQIWELLRQLLVSARQHHRRYFRHDRLQDCLLCQADSRYLRRSVGSGSAGYVNMSFDTSSQSEGRSASCDESEEDETSFTEDAENILAFPHIVGYYEVSSVKSIGKEGGGLSKLNVNQSIENLKQAVRELCNRLTKLNPQMPRRWANVQLALQNHMRLNASDCFVSVSEVARLARAHGVRDKQELDNVMHFLRAQGYVLYFPQLDKLRDLVILDPEWLARIFSSVVSFRETGIGHDGFMDRDQLKATWTHVAGDMRDRLLTLLHHFGVCLPVNGTNTELFPCKLPIGQPGDTVWPLTPSSGQRQLTYAVIFPTNIPPPFFSELIVAMFRRHVTDDISNGGGNDSHVGNGHDTGNVTSWRYYANHIVDRIRLETVGCRDCDFSQTPEKSNYVHCVHCELIAHRRIIQLTCRGAHPCCAMKQVNAILNSVVSKYEGLGSLQLDTIICPGCVIQTPQKQCRFSATHLASRTDDKVLCDNAHVLGSPKALLTGVVHESCFPSATCRPKSNRDRSDYSGCPRLFIVLPVNQSGVSFDRHLKLFTSSLVSDGFAVHLLCEFPDGYHVTSTPGYRLRKPRPFLQAYGNHVIAVLRMLALASGSTVSPQYANRTRAVGDTVNDLVTDLLTKFSGIKDTTSNMTAEALLCQVNERGKKVKREDLRKHLHVIDRPDEFGPLRRLVYGEHTHWLCNEHYRQLRMLSLGTVQAEALAQSLA